MLRLTALILLFIGGLQGYGQDWNCLLYTSDAADEL